MAKLTLDRCLELSATLLMKNGVLAPNAHGTRPLAWLDVATGRERGSVNIHSQVSEDFGTIRLLHIFGKSGEPIATSAIGYPVVVTSTVLPWGGLKWWLVCPFDGCNREVSKLYLPPAGRKFGCRHCHRLAYLSQRESKVRAAAV